MAMVQTVRKLFCRHLNMDCDRIQGVIAVGFSVAFSDRDNRNDIRRTKMSTAENISEISTHLCDALQQIIEKRDMRYRAVRSESPDDLEHIILLTNDILMKYDECSLLIGELLRFLEISQSGGWEYEKWRTLYQVFGEIVSVEHHFCCMIEEIKEKVEDLVPLREIEAGNPDENAQAFTQMKTVCGEEYERYQDYLKEMVEMAREIRECYMVEVYAPPVVTDSLLSDYAKIIV